MIDERHEELAALHALDLLEGAERDAFARELDQNAELRALVAGLRESAALLAHTAPDAAPPPELRARVLASVESKIVSSEATGLPNQQSKIIRPPSSIFRSLLPWAAAAGFALVAVWFARLYIASRSEAQLVSAQQALADLELKSTRNQLEAERILARRQLANLNQQVADTTKQLGEAQQRGTTAEDRLAATARQLADATQKLREADQQVATLNQRLDTATRFASSTARRATELDESFAAARSQVAALERRLKTEADLANFKITTLASLLKNSPQAVAVAVWNPEKQEGVLQVAKLPALATDKDYQLWVVDPQYPNPVDGGVFTVDPQTGEARLQFKAKQSVKAISAFAVTLERKGGVPKAEGPFVLLGK